MPKSLCNFCARISLAVGELEGQGWDANHWFNLSCSEDIKIKKQEADCTENESTMLFLFPCDLCA